MKVPPFNLAIDADLANIRYIWKQTSTTHGHHFARHPMFVRFAYPPVLVRNDSVESATKQPKPLSVKDGVRTHTIPLVFCTVHLECSEHTITKIEALTLQALGTAAAKKSIRLVICGDFNEETSGVNASTVWDPEVIEPYKDVHVSSFRTPFLELFQRCIPRTFATNLYPICSDGKHNDNIWVTRAAFLTSSATAMSMPEEADQLLMKNAQLHSGNSHKFQYACAIFSDHRPIYIDLVSLAT